LEPETVTLPSLMVVGEMFRKLIWVVGEAVFVLGLGYTLTPEQVAEVARGLPLRAVDVAGVMVLAQDASRGARASSSQGLGR
jgi:hypothetical protein